VPVMVVPSPERAALTAAEPEGPSAQIAWVCRRCAHIRGSLESRRACEACGASPASWEPVPVAEGAVVDAEAPAVGEAPIAVEPAAPTGFGGGVGLTPPGGTAVDVNPELRVRY